MLIIFDSSIRLRFSRLGLCSVSPERTALVGNSGFAQGPAIVRPGPGARVAGGPASPATDRHARSARGVGRRAGVNEALCLSKPRNVTPALVAGAQSTSMLGANRALYADIPPTRRSLSLAEGTNGFRLRAEAAERRRSGNKCRDDTEGEEGQGTSPIPQPHHRHCRT